MATPHHQKTSSTNPPSSLSKKKRICLFGGTFDPIHLGHTHIAEAALKALDLDEVIFLPCKQSPHKKGVQHASEHHRLTMCRLATAGFNWASVDDHDLTAPSPSYSWLTAEAMTARYPDATLFWLMGTDQWDVLPRWNRPNHLANLVEFIVFARGSREGSHEPDGREGHRLHAIQGDHPASATAIRNSVTTQLKTSWLHPAVAKYIIDNQLYLSD